jgi:hypothetical protein
MDFTLQPFHRDVADELLLADLRLAHAALVAAGKPLTFRAYRDIGRYSPSTIAERFGSWNAALQKGGLSVVEEKNVSNDALVDNLRIVWIALGKQPTLRDMNAEPSRYTASTYAARFGGWRRALVECANIFAGDNEEVKSEARAIVERPRSRQRRDPSLRLRFYVLRRDHFRCVLCGRSPAQHPGLVLEVDHILAWSHGGETVAANLRTLCYNCNRGKSDGAAT